MSCSTAVTTSWSPSTSHVTATGSIVITSISTPQASTSTTLITSCVSTRQSTSRSLPTGRSSLPDSSRRPDDLTVAATHSDRDQSPEDPQTTTSPRASIWTLLKAVTSQQDDSLVVRQVPDGLPDNCARWTVIPSLATVQPTPSTTLRTTTTLSSSITTIWQAKTTVYSACPTGSTSSAASNSSTVSDSTSSASDSSAASANPSSGSISSGIGSAASSTVSTGSTSNDSSSQATSSAPESTSSSKTWVDELSLFSNLTTASQTASASSQSSSMSTAVAVHTIDTSTNGTVVPLVVPTLSTESSGPSASPSPDSTSEPGITVSRSTSADAGAATQATMAKEGNNNKAVSAGAAVGGVVGLLLLIGGMLFFLRWWMRRKRGNSRKTLLMRQSWYPAGYDGPDHIARTSRVPTPTGRRNDNAKSFFSISGRGAVSGGDPGSSGASDGSVAQPRRFPGLALPKMPFFNRDNNQEVLDDQDDENLSPGLANRLSMPPMFSGTEQKANENRSKFFPTLHMPWSQPKTPPVPVWAEKYVDNPPSAAQYGAIASTAVAPPDRTGRQADVPRSILTPSKGFDGLTGPPRLDYEPAGCRESWGLNRSVAGTPPTRNAALPLANRPQLEWGHSYAASTVNPSPRHSVMPPNPRPFVPGPELPPSPTEESVYSRRESHRSHTSRASALQSRQSHHSRFSRDAGAVDLGRKPSRTSNPDLRSAILSRASASVASLGHLSFQSGTTDHSLPPLPEGGLRLDFPLPPSPSTRAPSMTMPVPRVPVPNLHTGPVRPLVPSKPSIKGSSDRHEGNSSSVFEYADYSRTTGYSGPATAGPSSTTGRDTIRQTADWYEKPLWVWDGQSGPLPPIPDQGSHWDGQSWKGSRKSVKWDPADGVARAL